MKTNVKKLNKLVITLIIIALFLSLVGCSGDSSNTSKKQVRVFSLKGPTGMGMVELMHKTDEGNAKNDYSFTLVSAPDEITADIIKGDFDIAAVPINLASVLYKKTEGAIKLAAVNTLGVVKILENGNEIKSIQDLKGKTIYAFGQGSTPEYILNYVLKKNGIDPTQDINIEYIADQTELVTKMTSGEVTIGMLPEPSVSVTIKKNNSIRQALDLTEEWSKVSDENTVPTQSVIVVNNKFIEENKDALDTFLKEYAESTSFVNTNVQQAATWIAEYGIVADASIAEKAIPNCNICCLTGEESKNNSYAMLSILFSNNPSSIGGQIPGEDFWYEQ